MCYERDCHLVLHSDAKTMARTWRHNLALLLLAGCSGAPRGDIHFSVQPKKDDARLAVTVEDGRAVIEVFSASGIGGAELEIDSAVLPRQILLRFHLRGLEELRFAYDDAVITASLSSAAGRQVHQSFSSAAAPAEAIASGDARWMKIRLVPPALPLQQGYIEVEAPQSFLSGGHRRMTIHWIDFYR